MVTIYYLDTDFTGQSALTEIRIIMLSEVFILDVLVIIRGQFGGKFAYYFARQLPILTVDQTKTSRETS